MKLIEELLGYVYLVVGILIVLALIGGGIFLFMYLKRKNGAKSSASEDDTPHMDYSSFNRRDAVDYVKFDDIIDFRWGGAIVTDNGTRFIAGLSINGYDFDMASAEERYQSMAGMIRVTNMITSPIMVHQDARKVDLSGNIAQCEECIKRLHKQLDALQSTFLEIQATIQDLAGFDQSEGLTHYEDLLNQNIGEQAAISHLIDEQYAIIEELRNTSGENVNPVRNACYLIDWVYDPINFASRELDKGGIYKEARRRLFDKLNIMAGALSQCGVKAKRMTCEELLETQYHHFHPYSSSRYKLEDILGSSYFHLFSTSDDSELYEEVLREASEMEQYENDVPYEIQLMEEEKKRKDELLKKYGYDGSAVSDVDFSDKDQGNLVPDESGTKAEEEGGALE